MCGLAGCFHRDGRQVEREVVVAMLDRQRHRGPDDRGVHLDGSVGLGLDRLQVLDLSPQGHQPMVAPDGRGALAYNGEVYNWRELRTELEAEGVAFTSRCDTEVVLHAIDRWGPERAIPRFNGMFALAWHDARRSEVVLARDRLGIKPLYVADHGDVVAFASEIKAITAHPAIPARPDMHALVTLLWHERLAGDWTAFEGIRAVLPGSIIRVTVDGLTTAQWFDLERDLDVDRILAARHEPFETQLARFREAMERSVELHLQSDAPLAVMCSGGLDSSLTTALASRSRPDLVAFVADAEGVRPSEADKAAVVARHLGVGLERVRIGPRDFPRLRVRAAWHNDDPIYFQQCPLALAVSDEVHRLGFTVLLTGEGSDELFGGYGWQREMAHMWRLRRWHSRLIPDVAPLRWLGRLLGRLAPLPFERLREEPLTPMAAIGRTSPAEELALDAGMRRARARSLMARLEAIPSIEERAFLAKGLDDAYHHLRVLLPTNDKMSMAASVEARVPFLENTLIDLGTHLPASAKIARQGGKRIVKAMADDLLPAEIVHARKIGFAVPNRFVDGETEILRGGIIADLFKWSSGDLDHLRTVVQGNLLVGRRLTTMELWARLHLDGASIDTVTDALVRSRAVATATA